MFHCAETSENVFVFHCNIHKVDLIGEVLTWLFPHAFEDVIQALCFYTLVPIANKVSVIVC